MDQLFLAVFKAVMGWHKGCLFSRYGPVRTDVAEYQKFSVRYRLASFETPPSFPPDADMAILKQEFPAPSSDPRINTHMAIYLLPVNLGWQIVRQLAALLLKLEPNAFEAPLLREGVLS